MSVTRPQDDWGKQLRGKLICPNCWHGFQPEQSLFIAKHPDLIGDPVAGSNEYLRFVPRHFTPKGDALDPHGLATTDLACPRCRLPIPDAMLEVPPLFVSIVGSPASGKSYFLTTMVWTLRRLLPHIHLAFTDADPVANSPIHEYEQTLFLNPHPDRPTEIRKTQRDDPRLHRSAMIDGVAVRFPLPLQFLMWPTTNHPRFMRPHTVGRIAVLYDNAGEDYLPGVEDSGSAVVQHLARSEVIMMLFDPTQDPEFRARCHSDDPQLAFGARPPGAPQPQAAVRQETVMRDVSVKVRRYLGLAQDKRVDKPLIIILPKFDVWSSLADISIDDEPYTVEGGTLRVDLDRIESVHQRIRQLMVQLCPDFVATAEGLSDTVWYIPISSLGGSPELVHREEYTFYGIQPQNIRPHWVAVPLVYSLCLLAPHVLGAECTLNLTRSSKETL